MRVKNKLKKNSEFLISENPQVDVASNNGLTKRTSLFPALQSRNYRLYIFGQFISVIGTWLQIVSQGWLVLHLSDSPIVVGVIAALSTIPTLLFSLFGGVIVDRFEKKKVLFFTQIANMVLALTLSVLTLTNVVTVPAIGIIALLMGTVNAVDAPARQSIISTLVNKDQLASGIALNSSIFNAARAIGPGIAGILIASLGTGVSFLLNGISYLAIIIALRFITINEKRTVNNTPPLEAIKDGINYSFTHPVIRILIIFTGVLSVFGWSYSTMMPVIAKNVFHLDAQGLGYLYSATGLGALTATFIVGRYSIKTSPVVLIAAGNVMFSVSIILFAVTSSFILALPLLFFIGMGLLSQAATINTFIQRILKNEYRGRVMSLYVLMFLGLAPFGNFEVGWITERIGISFALILNGSIVLLFGLIVFSYKNKIRQAYQHYKRVNGEANTLNN
ncbi:MFS transporter [Chryseosolibacter indicus]|uniref:MFS transporter n=1 Tax=Chryseosolibacter indicus TaxID=2782351 RepID=A0ABS5VPK3_9BACT|nr:MFS transporter [Chryseosolibacter indicus]MBT1703367.1 MFS transporter [Chryseosolibacter indicus]